MLWARDGDEVARLVELGERAAREATDWFELADAEWVPSLMVRRHRRLELRYR